MGNLLNLYVTGAVIVALGGALAWQTANADRLRQISVEQGRALRTYAEELDAATKRLTAQRAALAAADEARVQIEAAAAIQTHTLRRALLNAKNSAFADCLTVRVSDDVLQQLPAKVIVREVYVTPPARYMEPCESVPSDGTIGEEFQRLAELVHCERADKAAVRAWAASVEAEGL